MKFLVAIWNTLKNARKPVAWILSFVILIAPVLPFDEFENVRYVAIGMLFAIIMALLFEIHKIVSSKKFERTFTDFSDARDTYQKIISTALEIKNPIRIKMLGVALHYSWQPLVEVIEKYHTERRSLPKNLTIEIAVLDRDWLDSNLLEGNKHWKHRSNSLFANISFFLEKYCENITLNGNSIKTDTTSAQNESTSTSCINLEISTYPYTPNFHGILIEVTKFKGPYYNLFLSHCAFGEDEKLLVGENQYTWFNSKETPPDELSFEIRQYNSWFSFQNKECCHKEILNIVSEMT